LNVTFISNHWSVLKSATTSAGREKKIHGGESPAIFYVMRILVRTLLQTTAADPVPERHDAEENPLDPVCVKCKGGEGGCQNACMPEMQCKFVSVVFHNPQ
jgi:hypothetical protein